MTSCPGIAASTIRRSTPQQSRPAQESTVFQAWPFPCATTLRAWIHCCLRAAVNAAASAAATRLEATPAHVEPRVPDLQHRRDLWGNPNA